MLLAVRHGQTDWNLAGKAQGQVDRPLTELGRQQAEQSAAILQRFAARRGFCAAALPSFSSPLGRALETARIVNAALGSHAPAQVDVRLIEMSFGRWEGMTAAEMKADDPVWRKARKNDRWNVAPPGGESYADLYKRVEDFSHSVRQPAIIVTHLGVLRLLAVICGGVEREDALTMRFRNDALYVFDDGNVSVIEL